MFITTAKFQNGRSAKPAVLALWPAAACLLWVICFAPRATALPSLDPQHHLQASVDGTLYTLVQDADRFSKFYPVSPALRLIEESREGKTVPQLKIFSYAAAGVEHVVIHARFTLVPPAYHQARLKEIAAAWLHQQGIANIMPDNLELEPLGTTSPQSAQMLWVESHPRGVELTPLSRLPGDAERSGSGAEPRAWRFQTNASNASWNVIELEKSGLVVRPPGAHLAGSIAVVAEGAFPGTEFAVQITARGEQAALSKALLEGGGLLVFLKGHYPAISVTANVRAKMVRERVVQVLRTREEIVRKIRKWFWTREVREVREIVRELISYRESFEISGIQSQELNDEQWQAVAGKLMDWLRSEVLNGGPADPAPEAKADLAGALGELAPGLPRGVLAYGPGQLEAASLDLRGDAAGTNEVVWTQRFIVPQSWVASGLISLSSYAPETRAKTYTRLTADDTPVLCVRLPFMGLEEPPVAGASMRVAIGEAVSDYRFKNGRWSVANGSHFGVASKNLMFLAVDKREFKGWSNARATLRLTLLLNAAANSHRSLIAPGIEPREMIVEADKNGIIDFAGKRLPLQALRVDTSSLPWHSDSLASVRVRFGTLDGPLLPGRSLKDHPVEFPVFNRGNPSSRPLYFGGPLEGIEVEVECWDDVLGEWQTRVWKAPPETARQASATGILVLTPEDLGISSSSFEF